MSLTRLPLLAYRFRANPNSFHQVPASLLAAGSPVREHKGAAAPVESRVSLRAQSKGSPIRALLSGPTPRFNLGIGAPSPKGFPKEAMAAAASSLLREEGDSILQYGPTDGTPKCREQLALWVQGKGARHVTSKDVIVTAGGQQALNLAAETLIDKGDVVLVEESAFVGAIECFKRNGATVIPVPCDEEGMIPKELDRLIKEHAPKFVYTVPTFGNPRPTVMSAARRLEMLRMAVESEMFIVEDDPYSELYHDKPPPPSMLALTDEVCGSRDWLVHCGSASKMMGPGLRVGWMIGPADVLEGANVCKQTTDAITGQVSQALVAKLINSDEMRKTLAATRALYAERAKVLGDALRRELGAAIEFVQPPGGMFIWARLTGAGGAVSDASALAQAAKAEGVSFVPGKHFYVGKPDEGTMRLAFATMEPEDIEKAVKVLAALILEPCKGVVPKAPSALEVSSLAA